MIDKIISGGQTGADVAGLKFAKYCNIMTGGTAPRGFRTELGNMPSLKKYGLIEHRSSGYVQRTIENVTNSDATIVFLFGNSSGSKYTVGMCNLGQWIKSDISYWSKGLDYYKPCFLITDDDMKTDLDQLLDNFYDFLCSVKHNILNVAGNRESVMPGIENAVFNFFLAFKQKYPDMFKYIK